MAIHFQLNPTTHTLSGKGTSQKFKSPNTSGPFGAGMLDTLVIHYTGGASGSSSAAWLCNPQAQASAHVVVDRDGTVFQLLPFNQIAWHAGWSSHNGRQGLNKYSIGIEIDNAGILQKSGAAFVSSFGKLIAPEEVVEATHRHHITPAFWHKYTEVQLEVVEALSRQLVEAYGLKYLVGHEEISPGRKIDPGPAYPLEALRNKVLYSARNVDQGNIGRVTASSLNVRSGPGVHHPPVIDPLPHGSLVDVVDQRGDWLHVHVAVLQHYGWVHRRYVDLLALEADVD